MRYLSQTSLPGVQHLSLKEKLSNVILHTGYLNYIDVCANASHCSCIQLSVIGTPDEEDDGGKVRIIDREAFVGVDAAMMAHPWNMTVVPIPGFVALSPLVIFEI